MADRERIEILQDGTKVSYNEAGKLSGKEYPDGTYEKYAANGKVYSKDLPDGIKEYYYGYDELRHKEYPDGTKECYHMDGWLESKDLPDGTKEYYHENGKLKGKSFPDGTHEWYSEKLSSEEYSDGKREDILDDVSKAPDSAANGASSADNDMLSIEGFDTSIEQVITEQKASSEKIDWIKELEMFWKKHADKSAWKTRFQSDNQGAKIEFSKGDKKLGTISFSSPSSLAISKDSSLEVYREVVKFAIDNNKKLVFTDTMDDAQKAMLLAACLMNKDKYKDGTDLDVVNVPNLDLNADYCKDLPDDAKKALKDYYESKKAQKDKVQVNQEAVASADKIQSQAQQESTAAAKDEKPSEEAVLDAMIKSGNLTEEQENKILDAAIAVEEQRLKNGDSKAADKSYAEQMVNKVIENGSLTSEQQDVALEAGVQAESIEKKVRRLRGIDSPSSKKSSEQESEARPAAQQESAAAAKEEKSSEEAVLDAMIKSENLTEEQENKILDAAIAVEEQRLKNGDSKAADKSYAEQMVNKVIENGSLTSEQQDVALEAGVQAESIEKKVRRLRGIDSKAKNKSGDVNPKVRTVPHEVLAKRQNLSR